MTPDPRLPSDPLRRNRDFSLLLVAQGLSVTGREIGTIVLPLLVLAMTSSAAQVGLIAAAQALPFVLLSLPAGALVDRWNRKRVMVVCECVRVLALVSLPVAWLTQGLHLLHLYLVALATGTAFVFYNIAEVAAIPQVVAKAQLPRATSAANVVEWVGELSGPAIGGFLVGVAKSTVAGAMLAYLVQGVMQLLSVLGLVAIRRSLEVPEATRPADLRGEIRAGVAWLLDNAPVRDMAALAMALNLLFGPVAIAIIVLARDEYAASPEAIGLLFSIAGVCGVGSAVAAPWIQQRCKVGFVIVASVSAWALGMWLMAWSGSLVALALGWAIVTSVAGVYDVVATSFRLALIPAAMQGRVNGVFRFIAFGTRPLTLAAGGLLIAIFGPRETLWLLASGMVLTAVITASSSLRSAEQASDSS